tara:strand:- start:404 stop:1114 length:711 start_codon:yes stop_codon:yes gene_type:complete
LDLPQHKIFLDYEKDMKEGDDATYYVLGYKFRDTFEQIIINPHLLGLAEHRNIEIKNVLEATKHMFEMAIHYNAAIVAYSEAEKNIFEQLNISSDLSKYSQIKYINLLKATKSWINKDPKRKKLFDSLEPFRKKLKPYEQRLIKKYSLGSVMRLTNCQAPSNYAPNKISQYFKMVIKSLENKNQNYDKLTPLQKRKATTSLQHNKYDVEALPILYDTIFKTSGTSHLKRSVKKCFN